MIKTQFLIYLPADTSANTGWNLIPEGVLLFLYPPKLAGIVAGRLLRKKQCFSRILISPGWMHTVAHLLAMLVIFRGEGHGIPRTPSLAWMIGVFILYSALSYI